MSESTETDTAERKRPLILSTLGTNAYYIPYCEVDMCSPNYAACICRLEKMKENPKFKKSWSRCDEAQANNLCQAKKMRQQEIDAGECLFFVPRTNFSRPPIPKQNTTFDPTGFSTITTSQNSASYSRPVVESPTKPETKPVRITPSREKVVTGDDSLFDGFDKAISKALNQSPKESTIESVKITESKPISQTAPKKTIEADSPLALALKLKGKQQ